MRPGPLPPLPSPLALVPPLTAGTGETAARRSSGRQTLGVTSGTGRPLRVTVRSLQASSAAPLILLAQNRQAERDRQETERDRRTSGRTQADTEYLARELAAIRLALGEMPTRDYLDEELERLEKQIHDLQARLGDDGQER